MDTITVRDGRVFMQVNELDPYDLVQCSGLSDWNIARGAVSPVREQSLKKIGAEEVVGHVRASPDMPAFTIQGRLKEAQNLFFSLDCAVNVQVLMKDCGDPTDYYGFNLGMAWVRSLAGDASGEALAMIEGDDTPIGLTNPFSAVWGPYLIDFKVRFLSRRTLAETGTIQDVEFFVRECLEDCLTVAGNGQYGYAVATAQLGSPTDNSAVWWTDDYADTWALCSQMPFLGAEDISAVVKIGNTNQHRVIVARGSADGANPAEIAYADCTVVGQTAWAYSNVGVVNGQYITAMAWPNFRNLFCITNDGYVYRSRDGGVNWTIVYQHGTAVELNDISCMLRGRMWVVGDDDLVLFSEDYGTSWTIIDGPNDGLLNLNTVHVCDDRKVFVGDSAGMIYGTVNEGGAWSTLPPQGLIPTGVAKIRGFGTHWLWTIVDIAPVAPLTGNSRVLRSTDGGATWRLWDLVQNINPNNGLEALAVIDLNRVVVAGHPYLGTAFMTKTYTNIDRLV